MDSLTLSQREQNRASAAAHSAERFSWLDKNRYYYDDLKRFYGFHVETGRNVLEIGFGVGPILKHMKPAKGFGLDISTEVAAEAKRRFTEFDFSAWDGQSPLPREVVAAFPEGVDYILLVNAMGVWPDVQTALGHLREICHADTRIVASYYNFLWAPLFRIAQALRLKMPQENCNWLSRSDVANLFQISNYRNVKSGYRCLLPIQLGPISYLVNRYLAPLPFFNWLGCTHFVVARPAVKVKREGLVVSVIIPARNESGNIEPAVRRMTEVQRKSKGEKYEIIFVEGNSTDDTAAEIQRVIASSEIPKPFPVSYYKQPGKGKGDACRLGYAKAKGDLFLILDADLTVTPEDVPHFVDVYCEGHGEFINGCRLVYKMEKEAMRPINLMGNKFFSWAFTWLLGQRFKDTLCGTKVLSRKNYDRVARGRAYFGDFDPFGDFDLLFGASKLDLEIAEVPIRYRERTYGTTNISRWKHGWLLLRMCGFALKRIKFVP